MTESIGTQRLTGDGAVGPSGSVIRVYNIHIHADGIGSASIELRNGTADTAPEYFYVETPALDRSENENLGEGMLFTGGCFLDAGANLDYATISFSVIRKV